MQRVTWKDRRPGDCFLTAVPSPMHDWIWVAEKYLHPGAPLDFAATHAGIVGYNMPVNGTVIEAWLSLNQDSVAAINDASKYESWAGMGAVEVWRPEEFDPNALAKYVKTYGPERYGALNLFGFEWMAIVKAMTGRDVDNPIESSQVCSQGVGDFLGLNYVHTGAEAWILGVKIPDLDPLALRMAFLKNSQKPA